MLVAVYIENELVCDERKYTNSKKQIMHLNVEDCKTKFIPPNMKINLPTNITQTKTKFAVIGKSTVETAILYATKTSKKMILNFASGRHPGGGYKTGAVAQEESLCRASTLYRCLVPREEEFYKPNILSKDPAYTSAILYSTNVCFFRDQNHEFLDEPIYYDVLSCAGINQSKKPNKDALQLFEERIERILFIAFVAQAKILILGPLLLVSLKQT